MSHSPCVEAIAMLAYLMNRGTLKLATIMEIKDDNDIEPNWNTDFEFGEQSRKPLQLSL